MERIFKRDELMNIIESTIEYYDKNANKNERFSELIERVSLKEAENSINKIFDSK
ncbi:nitrite and sulphite reductase 4Fe-4S domain protein [[Clostridium] sordellii ATCC 9714]|nr:nitrite and sulphite reductase 4Fe-4S domain protein [[Clostridium] sordellii ATCC 9714] [Paeniclostridium sordellii ATCC 9714]